MYYVFVGKIDVYSNQWIAKAIVNLRVVMQKEKEKMHLKILKVGIYRIKSKDKCASML